MKSMKEGEAMNGVTNEVMTEVTNAIMSEGMTVATIAGHILGGDRALV
jgi:uncharacterized protein (UPF0297 family)